MKESCISSQDPLGRPSVPGCYWWRLKDKEPWYLLYVYCENSPDLPPSWWVKSFFWTHKLEDFMRHSSSWGEWILASPPRIDQTQTNNSSPFLKDSQQDLDIVSLEVNKL